jgi:hypothetical protein
MLAFCGVIAVPVLLLSVSGQGGVARGTEGVRGETQLEMPRFMEREMIQVSLDAMRRNGVLAELGALAPSAVVPVKHVIRGGTRAACGRTVEWAEDRGLRASDVVVTYGHGGVEQYHVELRQELPARVEELRAAMAEVLAEVAGCPGTEYATWMVDFEPPRWTEGR